MVHYYHSCTIQWNSCTGHHILVPFMKEKSNLFHILFKQVAAHLPECYYMGSFTIVTCKDKVTWIGFEVGVICDMWFARQFGRHGVIYLPNAGCCRFCICSLGRFSKLLQFSFCWDTMQLWWKKPFNISSLSRSCCPDVIEPLDHSSIWWWKCFRDPQHESLAVECPLFDLFL